MSERQQVILGTELQICKTYKIKWPIWSERGSK